MIMKKNSKNEDCNRSGRGYPEYEWYSNLNAGLKALDRGDGGEDSKILLERGRQAYEIARGLYRTAKHIVSEIETNPSLARFKNTSIYENPKRDLALLEIILEKYQIILP